MKITLRSIVRKLLWVFAVLLVVWMMIWGYVILNKKRIIASVTTELSSRIKGEIKIGDLEPSLISTFPLVSLRLSQVVVRDTLWKIHHHDLLKAENIFVRLRLSSLFRGRPQISKLILENASAYIYSDSTGISNEYMLHGNNDSAKSGNAASIVPDIELRNVRFTMDMQDRHKLYDFAIARLVCDISSDERFLQMDVKTALLIHSLAFNLGNGSFAKEKPVQGKFHLRFEKAAKKLSFSNIRLQIDNHPFTVTGMFDLSSKPPLYVLNIKTQNISYKKAAALVSANISKKLDLYAIEKSITSMQVNLDGSRLPNATPLVDLKFVLNNNVVSTPAGTFTDASVAGAFNNQLNRQEERADKNSGFTFTGFTGKWQGIRLRADSVKVVNLEHPVLNCDLHSSFQLSTLNDIVGSSTIEFTKGRCDLNIRYLGQVVEEDSAGASLHGRIQVEGAAIRYIPRNLLLANCSGKVEFVDKDVYVRQLKATSGNSQLIMNGGVKNLLSLIDKSPEKLILNWNISSPRLNLGDFLSYLGKRTVSTPPKASKRKILKLANKIDKMLEDCNVELQLNADRLIYKKFDASNVAANVQLTDQVVALNKVVVQHAGGTLSLNGVLREGPSFNLVKLNSVMDNVDVSKVFTAFDNFGQDGILDRNLRGRLTAIIDITGAITDKAVLVDNSIKGTIDIRLKDGELINFDPVMKIGERAFKKRDFSDVRFADLKEKLEINGSQIKVNRMEIASSVMTMFVEGIYDIKKGTDLSIQVPLSNLAKRDDDYEVKNKGIDSKTGISLRLRARTGADGKAKINWDPFNRSLKEQAKEVADSTNKAAVDSTGTSLKQ